MLTMVSFPHTAPDPLLMRPVSLMPLRDPAVRDLAWVIASPGLLDANHAEYTGQVVDDAWCKAQLADCMPWLSKLDAAPHALHKYIAAHASRRLGLYFETLIAFWLTHAPHMQLVARNLQVRDGSRTVGEYDLLWRNDAGHVRHWEVAVKFYLQAEAIPATRAFIGPGARDRLDLKLDRVFQHQLVLGRTPAGRAALPDGITLGAAQAFIKGFLFYPAKQDDKNSLAPGVSDTHLRGWWVRCPVATLPQTASDTGWMILPRLRWLSPVRLEAGASVMTNAEIHAVLKQHFAATSEALQVAELQRATDGVWHECARGFVVCSTWPSMDGVEFSMEQMPARKATSNSPR